MLKNHKQLLVTQQKIVRLQRALEETKKNSNPIAYKIQAEGVQSLINQMRAEVDEYLETIETSRETSVIPKKLQRVSDREVL